MDSPIPAIRMHEKIFRNILHDMKENDRGIRLPEEINPDAHLDDLVFDCCALPEDKWFSVKDFDRGPKTIGTQTIAQNEAYIEAKENKNKTQSRGATLIYEIDPNDSVAYARDYNRWEKP
jgi:hypothetical protein